MTYATSSGSLELGPTIASAAEGIVAEVVGRPEQVVKILYGLGSMARHETVNSDPAERMRKVAVMIAKPPELPRQRDSQAVLAWPQELVFEQQQPVGYLMPRIDLAQTVSLRTLLAATNATVPGWVRSFSEEGRTYAGINLCHAVIAAHSIGAVIGDFNDSNVLVSTSALVSLVDCDSMQVRDESGTVYLCDVGHSEYLPPELLGRTRSGVVRDKHSDYYSLAVHLYRLLLGGVHPFTGGVWTGGGDRQPTRSLVTHGQYLGGPGSPLTPGPDDPDFANLSAELRGLFDRAFRFGARRPADRPAPLEWRRALEATLR